jgi:hypothetical protein
LLSFVLVIIVILPAGGAVTSVPTDGWGFAEPETAVQPTPTDVQNQTRNDTEETPVRQENPVSADEESDPNQVSSYLLDSMARRVEKSVVELDRGEYERARRLVGDKYDRQLSQFVDVEGDVDVRYETLQSARSNQQEFINTTQDYQQTYQAYVDARQAGDEERARALARELTRIRENMSQVSRELRRDYRTVGRTAGADVNETIARIEAVNRSVAERHRSVLEAAFVGTRLTIETESETVSFRNPLVIRGQLRTENGTAIANHNVKVAAGNRTATVRTDEDGWFRWRYRPTTLSVDRSTLRVRYVPNERAPYRTSEASVPVSISQATPSVTFVETPTVVRFGQSVAVRGRLTVGAIPVPDIPVAVTLGGQRLSVVRTDEEGAFSLREPLLREVIDGNQTLAASVALSDSAIASTTNATRVTVAPTETDLRLSSVDVDNRTLELNGTLTTADGVAVSNSTVAVVQDGRQAVEAETGPDGRFRMLVSLERLKADDDSATVTLRYDGTGTSLASSTVRREVSLDGFGGTDGTTVSALLSLILDGSPVGPPGSGDSLTTLLTAMAVITAFTGTVLYTGLRRLSSQDVSEEELDAAPTSDADGENADQRGDRLSVTTATDHLEQGESTAAITLAYFAVREQLDGHRPGHPGQWRFYQSIEGDLDNPEEFHRLTELYERAAFADEYISQEAATEAVETARRILSNGGSKVRNE